MPLPLRHLPVVQNWDCHSCSHCCREYEVAVSAEERRRIEAYDWSSDPEIGRQKLFERAGPWWSRHDTLRHREEGGCVFLTKDNRCRIHEKLGAAAKPLACRLFPFQLVPVGDHWRVGVRYACPSAAENRGKPLQEHDAEIRALALDLEKRHGQDLQNLPVPPLRRRQRVSWPDLLRFARTLQNIVDERREPLEFRLRKCLALGELCRQARFDALSGSRLQQFLNLMTATLDEVPPKAADVPLPTAVGRMLFRQLAALYARKDRGQFQGIARRGRLALFLAGCRFAYGAGRVPKFNNLIGDVAFLDLELPTGGLTTAEEETLTRYYLVKLSSLQFFGPTNFHLSFWDGLESLALTLPVILWLRRAIRGTVPEQTLTQALALVDDHFGYNPILGKGRYKFTLRLLASQGELPRLLAWYSR